MSSVPLLDRLLHVTALLQADQERELSRLGLTGPRAHVLWVLHSHGPSTQVQLADAVGVTPRHMTTLIDGLEATNFVHRSPHPGDRRAIDVSLSEYGLSTMETMRREHDELDAALAAGLDRDVAERTAEGLDHLIARVSELIAAHAEASRS